MKVYPFVATLGGAVLCLLSNGCSKSTASTASANLEHVRYLVERVGMCIDCHSPRGPDGQLIKEKFLQGAELPFAATVPMPAWAPMAPSLAGLPQYSDEQLLSLLTKSHFEDGRRLRPPMAEFAMNETDARAVITFLRSLQPAE